MRSRKLSVTNHRITLKPEIDASIKAEKDETALPRKYYRTPEHTRAAQQQHQYIRVYTSGADFYKPEIYGRRVRVWATEWDLLTCTPSRGGLGRRAAMDIFRGVWFLVSGEISFFLRSFFTSNAHGLRQVRGIFGLCTSSLVVAFSVISTP